MSATNEEHPAGEHNNDANNQELERQESKDQKRDTGEDAGPQGGDPGEQAAQDTEETQPTEEKPAEAEAPEDLFDLLGEAGKQHKKKKPEPAKTASGSTAAGKSEPKEEKRYPAGAEVAYAGHKIELPREMTAAEIIEFLEDDFPELTKESTEFTHDETRNRIVPTRKALKEGGLRGRAGVFERAFPEEDEIPEQPAGMRVHTRPIQRSLPPVHRVLAYDGVYEVRDTALGIFTARLPAEARVNEGVALKVPKAPVSVLEKTLAIFAARPDREALVTVVYDHRDDSHHLVWVDQTATATSIDYDPVPESEHLTVYCEIHSHNVLDAFFSATDDGSEARSGGLYGVIGRVDLDRPHAAFRYSCGRHFRRIPAEDLFNNPARVGELVAEHPG